MGSASDAAVPYVTSEGRRRNMQANRRRDTGPELALRRLLHAAGLRYRVDLPLRLDGARVRPDIVFTRARVAVFVDGCFWHGCAEHSKPPRQNGSYWGPKIEGNRSRDARNDTALAAAGWTVLRVWEHDDPATVAQRVHRLVGQGAVE